MGGVYYTSDQAAALMGKVSKDKTISLFSQLVAAKLNVEIGNDGSCIAGTITDADNWMAAHPVGSNVAASSTVWQQIAQAHKDLDDYNNGRLCATSQLACEETGEPRPGSRGSFVRIQQPARAIGKGRAGNRSVARSCRLPACSDRCSTSRKAPSLRPCTDRRGVRTWQLRPYDDLRPDSTPHPRTAARSSIQSGCLVDDTRRPRSGRSAETQNTRKSAD